MTPSPAVAENLAQLVARESHSRFSRRKESTVVPECITAFEKMSALWHTLLRTCATHKTWLRSCESKNVISQCCRQENQHHGKKSFVALNLHHSHVSLKEFVGFLQCPDLLQPAERF